MKNFTFWAKYESQPDLKLSLETVLFKLLLFYLLNSFLLHYLVHLNYYTYIMAVCAFVEGLWEKITIAALQIKQQFFKTTEHKTSNLGQEVV